MNDMGIGTLADWANVFTGLAAVISSIIALKLAWKTINVKPSLKARGELDFKDVKIQYYEDINDGHASGLNSRTCLDKWVRVYIWNETTASALISKWGYRLNGETEFTFIDTKPRVIEGHSVITLEWGFSMDLDKYTDSEDYVSPQEAKKSQQLSEIEESDSCEFVVEFQNYDSIIVSGERTS